MRSAPLSFDRWYDSAWGVIPSFAARSTELMRPCFNVSSTRRRFSSASADRIRASDIPAASFISNSLELDYSISAAARQQAFQNIFK